VYLSPIIDCFDGLVVSWTIGMRPDAELVNTMLDAAVETVAQSNDRPVVHSDRGAHYRWPGWLSRIGDANLTRSMSRKGCSTDNAACEGFFGRLKTELFCPANWQATTIEQFSEAVDSYIRWFRSEISGIQQRELSSRRGWSGTMLLSWRQSSVRWTIAEKDNSSHGVSYSHSTDCTPLPTLKGS
jgi:putative transposase